MIMKHFASTHVNFVQLQDSSSFPYRRAEDRSEGSESTGGRQKIVDTVALQWTMKSLANKSKMLNSD